MTAPLDEHDIQRLVAEGNDEQVVRLSLTLLGLGGAGHVAQRTLALEDLGERYLILALSREKGVAGQNIEEALKCLYDGSLAVDVLSQAECDPPVISWYHEATEYLEEALRVAPETFDKSRTIQLACLARTLYRARLGNLIETSNSDLIGGSDGIIYLTRAGERKIRERRD